MEAYNRIYPMAFFVLLIFTYAYCCASSILVECNTSSSCNAITSLDECVIEDDLEVLVDPYLRSRMLQSSGRTGPTNDPKNHVFPCGRNRDPKQYNDCINGCVEPNDYNRRC